MSFTESELTKDIQLNWWERFTSNHFTGQTQILLIMAKRMSFVQTVCNKVAVFCFELPKGRGWH